MDLRTEYHSGSVALLDQEKGSTSRFASQEHSQLPKCKTGGAHGNDHIGHNTSRGFEGMREKSRPEMPEKTALKPKPDTMIAFGFEVADRDWLIGPCPCREANKVETSCAKLIERPSEDLSCPSYLFQKLVEVGEIVTVAGHSLTNSAQFGYISKWLIQMTRRSILTLHHSSTAMQIIGMSNPVTGEYIGAMISVLLAICYLLALLNVLIALGKIIKLMGKTLWFIWVPLKVALLLLKWCISS